MMSIRFERCSSLACILIGCYTVLLLIMREERNQHKNEYERF